MKNEKYFIAYATDWMTDVQRAALPQLVFGRDALLVDDADRILIGHYSTTRSGPAIAVYAPIREEWAIYAARYAGIPYPHSVEPCECKPCCCG